jgi:hypothetical protein
MKFLQGRNLPCFRGIQDDHRSLKTTSEAMLEAKDNELLAALRKTALLSEELGQLRQQQQRSVAFSQQQQQQARISSSSAMDAAGGAGADVFGVTAGVDEGGGSTPSRQDGSGMTGAAYASQQLLSGYTASEPGKVVHSKRLCGTGSTRCAR